MRHLSHEELLIMAEGTELPASVKEHLLDCSSCSSELSRLRALLRAVASIEERQLDDRLLDQITEGILEQVSALPEERRPTRRGRTWRGNMKWVSAAALPLAAAVLLFLLPQKEGLTPPMYLGSVTSSADDLLSPHQWDMVWYNLTEDMPELSVLHQVSTRDQNPYDQLRDLTQDELQNLLDLLEGSNHS